MNKVDALVRELLITYPTLFTNRLDALLNIFTNSGYQWDENGCIISIFENKRDVSAMHFSDLDETDAKLASDLERDSEIFRSLTAHRIFEAKKERMERQLIAEHIDAVASEMPTGARVPYEKLNNLSLYSLDDASWRPKVPFGSMDADWLAAAEELIGILKYSFNVTFSLHYDEPSNGRKACEPSMFSRMPEHFQNLYTKICEIADKLDAQSGKRARAKAIWASINPNKLLAEVEQEDNQPC